MAAWLPQGVLATLQQHSVHRPDLVELCAVLQQGARDQEPDSTVRAQAVAAAGRSLMAGVPPQVKATLSTVLACAVAQPCSACEEGRSEEFLPEPAAIAALLDCLSGAQACPPLLTACADAVVTMLTCKTCHGHCTRRIQLYLCSQGAVPVLVQAVRNSLSAAPPQGPIPGLQNLLHALSLLLFSAPQGLVACMSQDGWRLMKAVLGRFPRDPATHSHVCIILAALFPAWSTHASDRHSPKGASGANSPALHSESLLLLANLAAANAQHGHLEAARTATWALSSMAWLAATHPSLADNAMPTAQQQQLWVMLTGQVMLIVLDLLASVAKQDNSMAKHCLRYVEVVAGACLAGGPSSAAAACGDGSATQFLRDALLLANAVMRQSSEIRLQVAALRCMHALLSHPQVYGMPADEDTVGALLQATSMSRFTPGSNPKEVALLQVYGMCVMSKLVTSGHDRNLLPATSASISPEVHASVGAVVSFVTDMTQARASGWKLDWQNEEARHEVDVMACRQAPGCLSNHEDLSSGLLLAPMAAACAHILSWCSIVGLEPQGVNAVDGQGATVLHRFAAAGLLDSVHAFIRAAGRPLEINKQDGQGLTAMQVAGMRGHTQVAAALAAHASGAMPPTPTSQHARASTAEGFTGAAGSSAWGPTGSLGSLAMPLKSLSMDHTNNNALPGLNLDHLGSKQQQQLDGDAGRMQAMLNNLVSPSWGQHAQHMKAPGSAGLQNHGTATQQPNSATHRAASLPAAGPAPSTPGGASTTQGAAFHTGAGSDHSGLDDGGGMNSNGFRVNTAALSQLIDSVVSGNLNAGSLPPWLSAGVAAAVTAHEEQLAAASTSGMHKLDMSLLAEAEALLNSQMLGIPNSDRSGNPGEPESSAVDSDTSANSKHASKHLWLGNLSTKLPRSVLKAVFEHFGVVEDVVTFPGRMYAFVNFKNCDDAVKAALALNDREVPPLTGNKRLVVKFRPSKKALGKSADGPGADAAAAAAAAAATSPESSGPGSNGDCSSNSLDGEACEGSKESQLVPGDAGDADAGATTGSDAREENTVEDGPSSSDSGMPPVGLSSSAEDITNAGSSSPCSATDADDTGFAEGRLSKHLWLGNIPFRPNKQAMEALFSQFGAVESIWVFPGKTYAFVNFKSASDALKAKTTLDGQVQPTVSGHKPLLIRFQKDSPSTSPSPGPDHPANASSSSMRDSSSAEPEPALTMQTSASMSADLNAANKSIGSMLQTQPSTASSLSGLVQSVQPAPTMATAQTQRSKVAGKETLDSLLVHDKAAASNLAQLAAATSLSRLLDDDLPTEPAINLSNRLNPNNIHFDKELAARYKRMSKAEKETLWAQDRMLQQISTSSAAAALLQATTGVGGGVTPPLLPGLPFGGASTRTLAATLAQAGLPAGLAAGLNPADLADATRRMEQLLPRVPHMSLQQAAANLGQHPAGVPNPLADPLLGNAANAAVILQAQQALSQLLSQHPTTAALQAAALVQQQQQQLMQLAGLNPAASNGLNQLAAAAQLQSLMGYNMGGNGGMHKQQEQSMLGDFGMGQQQGNPLGGLHKSGLPLDMNAMIQAQALASLNAQNHGRGAPGSGGFGHGTPRAPMTAGLTGQGMFGGGPARSDTPASAALVQAQLQHMLPSAGNPAASQLPANFLCPLSSVVMFDPVVAADGVTYERSAIAQWLSRHTVSPVTRQPLSNKYLAPNHSLKAAITAELSRPGLLGLA